MKQGNRNFLVWAGLFVLVLALFNMFSAPSLEKDNSELTYSEFWSAAQSKRVKTAIIRGRLVKGQFTDDRAYKVDIPASDNELAQKLSDLGIQVSTPAEESGSFLGAILPYVPFLLIIGVWIYAMRQMQGGGNKAMGFGKSRAKLLTKGEGHVTFDDVAGVDEAKQDVVEIVEFLQDPSKFQRLGGKIPRGVLLVGSPGTGKTLLAKAIAGEAEVPFFSISGSDFVEMFVGVGASRVRDMFEQAKKEAPCIVFIDEIDAVGRHRGAGVGGGNDEREQTLNQLLVEMDGFEENENVIILAATNRPDVLDPALLRPGRFDRQVTVPLPDLFGREKILEVHSKKVPLDKDVNLKTIAKSTPGFSGADLENLVNEAALTAARTNKKRVTRENFEQAKDKIIMGSERRSLAMSDDEIKLTAYHEAGHAVIAYHMEASDPIHKATIVPRGRALGMVVRLPERDRVSMTRGKLQADLAVAMGGRLAEEIIFGYDKTTTGASSDIQYATDIARRMVMEWGMSDKMGPLAYGEPQQEVFLGHSVTQTKTMSEETARNVDAEVRQIVDDAYSTAKKLLKKYSTHLELLAQALLEYETLTGEEIDELLKTKKLVKKKTEAKPVKPKTTKKTPEKGASSSLPSTGSKPKSTPKPNEKPQIVK